MLHQEEPAWVFGIPTCLMGCSTGATDGIRGTGALTLPQNSSCFIRRARSRLAAARDIKHPALTASFCPDTVPWDPNPSPFQQAAALAYWQQGDTLPLKIRISGFLMFTCRKRQIKPTTKNTVAYLSVPPERWAEAKQVTGKLSKMGFFQAVVSLQLLLSRKQRPSLQLSLMGTRSTLLLTPWCISDREEHSAQSGSCFCPGQKQPARDTTKLQLGIPDGRLIPAKCAPSVLSHSSEMLHLLFPTSSGP